MASPLLPDEVEEALLADLGPQLGQPGDPDEAMVKCLMDLYTAVASAERCAIFGRRELAWHFDVIATDLAALLRRHFKYEAEEKAP